VRVTLTLDPADVEMLDKLAELEGSSRSAEVRSMLAALRPSIRAVIAAIDAASVARSELTEAAARTGAEELERLMPKLGELQGQVLGALAQIEMTAASQAALLPLDGDENTAGTEGGEGR